MTRSSAGNEARCEHGPEFGKCPDCLMAERDRYREALRFYAGHGSDWGERAREALDG